MRFIPSQKTIELCLVHIVHRIMLCFQLCQHFEENAIVMKTITCKVMMYSVHSLSNPGYVCNLQEEGKCCSHATIVDILKNNFTVKITLGWRTRKFKCCICHAVSKIRSMKAGLNFFVYFLLFKLL